MRTRPRARCRTRRDRWWSTRTIRGTDPPSSRSSIACRTNPRVCRPADRSCNRAHRCSPRPSTLRRSTVRRSMSRARRSTHRRFHRHSGCRPRPIVHWMPTRRRRPIFRSRPSPRPCRHCRLVPATTHRIRTRRRRRPLSAPRARRPSSLHRLSSSGKPQGNRGSRRFPKDPRGAIFPIALQTPAVVADFSNARLESHHA